MTLIMKGNWWKGKRNKENHELNTRKYLSLEEDKLGKY